MQRAEELYTPGKEPKKGRSMLSEFESLSKTNKSQKVDRNRVEYNRVDNKMNGTEDEEMDKIGTVVHTV